MPKDKKNKNLVIVESPTKAKTIAKFLTKDFKIISSQGHLRDLPEKSFGLKIKGENFIPKYVIPKKSKNTVKKIVKEAKDAKDIILATDEDREGEAIAWHILEVLKQKLKKEPNYQRITFHEITKSAILKALQNPRKINLNLVEAQKVRRFLDRIVGYLLSPFLWKKVAKGLSAGRVQSSALRLIVEREREIQNFKSQEYWKVKVKLLNSKKESFLAELAKINSKNLPKPGLSKKEAEEIKKELEKVKFKVSKVEIKEVLKKPLPPFTTSTLQQEAFKKLGWKASFTMKIAQALYEKGFITYHRTDSLNLSNLALEKAKEFIIQNFGKEYYPQGPTIYKAKSKLAQEAHEAIRPTDPFKLAKELPLDKFEAKLYELIWKRFIASQMAPLRILKVQAKILAQNKKEFGFQSQGQKIIFEGFKKVWEVKLEEAEIPELKESENLSLKEVILSQHFTKPPARYSDSTLIKTLEDYGIGRPSTYAPTISILEKRGYIERTQDKKLKPTELGILVNKILTQNFPEIFDYQFTAQMEDKLDLIAQGKENPKKVLANFYYPFKELLTKKYSQVKKEGILEVKGKCPQCKEGDLLVRISKFGKFLACSNFPKCRYKKDLHQEVLCPQCKEGNIKKRLSKKKKVFYSCSNYPKCKFASAQKPLPATCLKCKAIMVEGKSKPICLNCKLKSTS